MDPAAAACVGPDPGGFGIRHSICFQGFEARTRVSGFWEKAMKLKVWKCIKKTQRGLGLSFAEYQKQHHEIMQHVKKSRMASKNASLHFEPYIRQHSNFYIYIYTYISIYTYICTCFNYTYCMTPASEPPSRKAS